MKVGSADFGRDVHHNLGLSKHRLSRMCSSLLWKKQGFDSLEADIAERQKTELEVCMKTKQYDAYQKGWSDADNGDSIAKADLLDFELREAYRSGYVQASEGVHTPDRKASIPKGALLLVFVK